MKARSAKNKGQRASKETKGLLLDLFVNLQDEDIFLTPSGCIGKDLVLSPKAKELFPFSIEVKNQERLNIWTAINQARSNTKNGETPLVVFKKNHEEFFVALPISFFLSFFEAKEIFNGKP